MNLDALYLRPDARVEPLINSWYAWSFLVSPLTLGMVTRNLHLRVLESYLQAPDKHAAAIKNSALRGGFFVDHQGAPEEIRRFVAATRNELAGIIGLSNDIHRFGEWLNRSALGDSLAHAYRELPPSLQGKVELAYDLYNRPGLRFIERLFYRSPFYKPELQSVELSRAEGDHRPFVLSSPRLGEDVNRVRIRKPFSQLDQFFAMRFEPASFDCIKEMTGFDDLDGREREVLASLLTDQPPRRRGAALEQNVRVRFRYFGHATVLMEGRGVTLLTDPIIAYDQAGAQPRMSFADLPKRIDYVLLTHNHQDHVMLETLLQLKSRIGTIIVPRNSGGFLQDTSMKLMLEAVGFKRVIELDELESLDIEGGQILGVPFLGEHGDLGIHSKLAFHVSVDGASALFAADSNNLDERLYERVSEITGDIDYIFIGMECEGAPCSWLYGPLYDRPLSGKHDRARRLDGSSCRRALPLVRQFNPQAVYVYAMGAEPWLQFISSIEYTAASVPMVESDALIGACRELGIPAERLYLHRDIQVGIDTPRRGPIVPRCAQPPPVAGEQGARGQHGMENAHPKKADGENPACKPAELPGFQSAADTQARKCNALPPSIYSESVADEPARLVGS